MKHLSLRGGLVAALIGSALVAVSTLGVNTASAMADPNSKTNIADQPGVPDGWVTDYEGALKQAKKENRPVLMLFTGSDWCPPCMFMERKVFSTETFENYAKDNLVSLFLDYPQGKPQSDELKHQNAALMSQYAIRGYPTMILLSPEGKKLWEHIGYMQGAEKKSDS
jgi:thioredoxin-related protein